MPHPISTFPYRLMLVHSRQDLHVLPRFLSYTLFLLVLFCTLLKNLLELRGLR